jgi:hypothetical protein
MFVARAFSRFRPEEIMARLIGTALSASVILLGKDSPLRPWCARVVSVHIVDPSKLLTKSVDQ